MKKLTSAVALCAVCASASIQNAAADPPSDFVVHPEAPSVTYHSIEIDGETIHYQAQAGTLSLTGAEYEETARIFYISYRKLAEPFDSAVEGLEPKFPDPATRPITFSFNGGPGSSSVWLHLGIFGPKKVKYADDFGNPGPPPYTVEDNPQSLLDQSDFVFIDPVSTGFSRASGEADDRDFYGLENDARSVSEFIRRFVTRWDRWGSPKFIAGESYGTTRCAAIAPILQDRHGMHLNGVVLVSAVLNFQTIRFGIGNDLPHVLFLPTFAATAQFHTADDPKTGDELREFMDEVEAFAIEEYMPALAKGDSLPEAERDAIVRKLAEYTGLSETYIRQVNMRLSVGPFNKELLREEARTVGRLDSRFKGIDREAAGDRYEYDPSYAAIQGIYTGALNNYLRTELNYRSDLPYEILTGVSPWSYEPAGRARYVNVAERLRGAMAANPHLRVFLASGYYDLATPHFASDYTFNTMQLEESLQDNYETHYYEAGHMMYLHRPSIEKLKADLDAFYESVPVAE